MANTLISEIILSLICFLGLYIGLFIGYLAKEELKEGKKYFAWLQKIIFITIIFLILHSFGFWILGVLFSAFFIVIFLSIKHDYHKAFFFALGFFLFMGFVKGISAIPVLLFFYGIPTGSLFILKYEKKKYLFVIKQLFLEYWYFLLIIGLLLIIRLFT